MTWMYITGIVVIALVGAAIFIGNGIVYVSVLVGFTAIALHDLFQTKRSILRNFPVLGHLRYYMEKIGPELRQYWVASDKEEQPFNRSERAWIYATAKGENNFFGFGTTEMLYGAGYPIIKNAVFPFQDSKTFHPDGAPSARPCAIEHKF